MPRQEHYGYITTGRDERDVAGCNHCRRQIVIQPPQGATSFRLDRCHACMRTICAGCAGELARTMKCRPFEQRIEQLEQTARLARVSEG